MKKGKFYTLEDYEITKDGQIINKHNNHILKPQPNGKGYLRVIIGHKRYFVHRLVAEKYLENKDNKPQINHKDGNKLNNSIYNLEFVTNQENRNHAIKNGLHLCGEKCSYSKLKEKEVIYILNNLQKTNSELSKMFNVSRATINDIRKGKTWKHLKRYAEL
ncbi:HNH endonuclease signature motif containing protein [uncultured Rikenella sp.]|uniref:HNH endonuclease signature motif containing protein n=1 Tax=uncultured Rikenella sp. TaxID=368003 RepID=UPI00260F045C|nr:HNH endonuclease signature motif containing protein [uncultured Rikenella sp.]